MAGGSDQYLIDLSYKVIPQFKSDIGTIVVFLPEKMIGLQINNFRVSSDVTSITIKNPENYPYLTVSLNALVFDLS